MIRSRSAALLAQEVMIGVFMGLFLQIVVAALVGAGQLIAGGMGLSMANMIDPNLGNVPTLSQFFFNRHAAFHCSRRSPYSSIGSSI